MKPQNIKKHNQLFGSWGEDCAAAYLEDKGYRIVARNVRTPEGEIDLIVEKEGKLVFVEVKARSHGHNGYPEEAITEEKQEHMIDSAEYFLQEHPDYAENWRIDVVAVTGTINSLHPQIEWFEDAA